MRRKPVIGCHLDDVAPYGIVSFTDRQPLQHLLPQLHTCRAILRPPFQAGVDVAPPRFYEFLRQWRWLRQDVLTNVQGLVVGGFWW